MVQPESVKWHGEARSERKSVNYKRYNAVRMSTLARIQDLAAKEFSIDPTSLDPHVQLDTLGIDSLSFIEFMFKVEEEFGVSVSDENLKGIKTLADLERHVVDALAAAGKG
jgi:acyl carrier protein